MDDYFIKILLQALSVCVPIVVVFFGSIFYFDPFTETRRELKKYKKLHTKGKMTVDEYEKLVNYRKTPKDNLFGLENCKYCNFYFTASDFDYEIGRKYEHGYCKLRYKQSPNLENSKVYADYSCQFNSNKRY